MTAAAQVDELISDLVDGGKVARREAARSLALIGPEAKAAVPALARALDDDEVQVFFWSATALANLGPAAHEATPELIKRLSRGGRRYRDQVRLRVVTALTRIGPAAVPQLIDALGDGQLLHSQRSGQGARQHGAGGSRGSAATVRPVGRRGKSHRRNRRCRARENRPGSAPAGVGGAWLGGRKYSRRCRCGHRLDESTGRTGRALWPSCLWRSSPPGLSPTDSRR